MASEATWNPALWEAAGGRVPDGWSLVPFGELLASPKSIAVGVMYPGDDVSSGVPLIRVGDVQNGGTVGEPQMRISGKVHEEYRRTELQGDELLITLVGKPGACVLARPSMKGWNVARALAVARLQDPSLRSFIKTVLEGPVMRSIISGMLNTTVQPTLNLKEIRSLPVPVPRDHREAQKLGGVAELFNARIDLCRQTNTTLESIAQALFKSWFIDFEPVRDRAEGREPEGMDAVTAALFPAEFEESALGLIPKGWKAGIVEDLLVLQRGFDLPAAARTDGVYAVLAAGGPHGTHREAMVKGPGVTTGRSGVIGRVFYSHEDFWPLNTSLWVKEFKVATAPFAYQYLKTMDLARLNAGSAVPTLNRNDVHALPAVIPSSALVGKYTATADALLRRMRANALHAAALCEVRDSLLPRLISGKLRLPEAVEQLEAA